MSSGNIDAVINKCVDDIWAEYDKDNSGELDKEETKAFVKKTLCDMDDGNDGGEFSEEDFEEGAVKWFNTKKGYGFITRDQGDDIFVHFRNIKGQGRRSLTDGERVTFVVTEGDKGLQADHVSPIA